MLATLFQIETDSETYDDPCYVVSFHGYYLTTFASALEASTFVDAQPAELPTYDELCDAARFVHNWKRRRRGDRYATERELDMILSDPLAWSDMVAAEVCAAYGCGIDHRGGWPFIWEADASRYERDAEPECLESLRYYLAGKARAAAHCKAWEDLRGAPALTLRQIADIIALSATEAKLQGWTAEQLAEDLRKAALAWSGCNLNDKIRADFHLVSATV